MRSQFFKKCVPLQSAFNVRHLGGYDTGLGAPTSAKFYRADCFVPLSGEDRAVLLGHGIKSVVDMRSAAERQKMPSGFLHCDEVVYCAVSFLSEAMMPLEEAQDFNMGRLYISMLENGKPTFRKIFTLLEAGAAEGNVLFHCSAGKDRTGMVAALLLDLAGVSAETIRFDYAQTEGNLAPVLFRLRAISDMPKGMEEVGEEVLSAREENMDILLDYLKTHYTNAWNYLVSAGLSNWQLASLKTHMTEREE